MTSDDKDGKRKRGKLSPDAQDKIGEKLRDMYDSVITEPVPDKFLDLLENLEKAEQIQEKGDE